MTDLHVQPSFENVIDLGLEVYEYATKEGDDQYGITGLHTVDSALELGQNVNALLRDHDDAPSAEARFAFENDPANCPHCAEDCVESIGNVCRDAKQSTAQAGAGTLIKLAPLIRWFLERVLPDLFKGKK